MQDKDFLKGVKEIGSLDTTQAVQDKDFLKGVKEIGSLDNKYIYADNILSVILSQNKRNGKTIYTTRRIGYKKTEYLSTDGVFFAHGETIKKSLQDLNWKIISEKIKKAPILKDTIITVEYYHTVTGACTSGCEHFKNQHGLKDKYKAKDLLPILEKLKGVYGIEKFKSLINW